MNYFFIVHCIDLKLLINTIKIEENDIKNQI